MSEQNPIEDPADGTTEEVNSTAPTEGAQTASASGAVSPSREALLATQRALEEENDRLRSAYAAAQRSRYRRTALALCLVGIVSAGLGAVFVTSQRVLFAIGATGLFAGVMTYYLSPTQFVAATIGDRLVEANVATLNGFVQTLGLSGTVVYVPAIDTAVRTDVVAFLPQATDYTMPTTLTPGVVPDADPRSQGVAVVPVGGLLFEEFTRALAADPATDPEALGEQLGEAITDQFELATTVDTETAITGESDEGTVPAGRLTVVSSEPVFATTIAFDHPIGSFVASATASVLSRPVELRVDEEPAEDVYQATVSWEDPS